MANNILFGTICLAVSRYKVGVDTVFEAANIVAIPLPASDRRDLNTLATSRPLPQASFPSAARQGQAAYDSRWMRDELKLGKYRNSW